MINLELSTRLCFILRNNQEIWGNEAVQEKSVLKPGQKLCRDKEVKTLKRRIEILRKDMILAFDQYGADMSNPNVLRLSQLLDEQLNRYDRCLHNGSSVQAVTALRFPFLSMIKSHYNAGELVEH